MAKRKDVRLQAEFISNDRNRMMYVTYKFLGFQEIKKEQNFIILENRLLQVQPYPAYMKIDTE